jgi:glycosyltransferase involved in cell wall biosynthesis
MSESKAISVVIPTFNRDELTSRAVNSVLCSRPHEIEIVVVDDCSSVPYRFAGQHNVHGIGVTVLRTPLNVGPGLARKFGVEHCGGLLVAFLDSDDVYNAGWLDEVLEQTSDRVAENGLLVAGKTKLGSAALNAAHSLLFSVPVSLRLAFARLVVVFFNPFYTPSVVLSRGLCQFSDSLRYCEDYFMNAMALFSAGQFILSDQTSCTLAKRPGGTSGESANRKEMFLGELAARYAILSSPKVPLLYKIFVPLGVLYQFARALVQSLFRWRDGHCNPSFSDAAN